MPVGLDIYVKVKGASTSLCIKKNYKYYQVFIISGVVLWNYQPTLQFYATGQLCLHHCLWLNPLNPLYDPVADLEVLWCHNTQIYYNTHTTFK